MSFILSIFRDLKIPKYKLWLEVSIREESRTAAQQIPDFKCYLHAATAFNLLFKSDLPASRPLIFEIKNFQVFMFYFEEICLPFISEMYSLIDLKLVIMFQSKN